MCITLIKLSINSPGEVQPKWTMPGRVKYIPNNYGLRHLIQQTPTWISLITVFAYITLGTNQQS